MTHANETAFINANVGRIGILDNDNETRFGLEYRFVPITVLDIVPSIGGIIGSDGAKYVYVEARHDFYLTDSWILIPSFGPGLFFGHDKIELGNRVEFRSGLELAYGFQNNYRVGVAIYHLSNGGISSINPGTESIIMSLSIPIGK